MCVFFCQVCCLCRFRTFFFLHFILVRFAAWPSGTRKPCCTLRGNIWWDILVKEGYCTSRRELVGRVATTVQYVARMQHTFVGQRDEASSGWQRHDTEHLVLIVPGTAAGGRTLLAGAQYVPGTCYRYTFSTSKAFELQDTIHTLYRAKLLEPWLHKSYVSFRKLGYSDPNNGLTKPPGVSSQQNEWHVAAHRTDSDDWAINLREREYHVIAIPPPRHRLLGCAGVVLLYGIPGTAVYSSAVVLPTTYQVYLVLVLCTEYEQNNVI